MGKINRIRIRGKQRPRPDVALVAQAIIQLGRELREQEQQAHGTDTPALSRAPKKTPPSEPDEASA